MLIILKIDCGLELKTKKIRWMRETEHDTVTKPVTSPNYYGPLANKRVTFQTVTTARLKTYNVYPDIDDHGARDEMCRYRQGRQRDNRSKELRPTGWQKKKTKRAESDRSGKRTKQQRMIRRWMG
ncbi:hypothetical protein TNCV_3761441 [Trichonephila clavipes]|nr:hypothetical protein TNCV_3761441 [Trichonephila clavipes]